MIADSMDNRSAGRSWSAAGVFVAGAAVVGLMTVALALAGKATVFGSSHVNFSDEGALAKSVAGRAIELNAVGRIGDEELRTIMDKIRSKAAEGDVRAAGVVLEIARIQRNTPPSTTGQAPG